MASIIETLRSSIKVSITSWMLDDLSRDLRLKLYLAQGELGCVPQVQSCIDNFIPNGRGGGKSIRPCRSKNSCLWCTPQELAKHRTTVSELLEKWDSEGKVFLATFTLQFPRELDLGARYRNLKQVWQMFTGDSRFHKLRTQYGLKYVRILEEVVSQGVWFPHYHVVLSCKSAPSNDLQDVTRSLREIWTSKAHKVGLTSTLASVQTVSNYVSGTHWRLADYLVKHGRVGLYLDTESVDTEPEGLPPLQVFQLFVATGDADSGRLWDEFQFHSLRQHRITYSVGARG